jgi:gamma-glutamylcyclotransferase (GGCT)/AIG2-like uncharacterized protein YtfP
MQAAGVEQSRTEREHGEMASALFVYGTLMPGHLRWNLLEARAHRHGPARVPGLLYDTGNGWPAADLSAALGGHHAEGGLVPGWLVELDSIGLGSLLAELDAMEGIGSPPDPATDPYLRVRVTVDSANGGREAWAYHATSVDPSWQRIERWEGMVER